MKDTTPLQTHKLWNRWFWDRHGPKLKGISPRGKNACINDMLALGEIKIIYNSTHTRKDFDRKKKRIKSFTGFKHCIACGGYAQVRHHLIWLKNGGRNHKRNIVGLCRPCHALIHPWLR